MHRLHAVLFMHRVHAVINMHHLHAVFMILWFLSGLSSVIVLWKNIWSNSLQRSKALAKHPTALVGYLKEKKEGKSTYLCRLMYLCTC